MAPYQRPPAHRCSKQEEPIRSFWGSPRAPPFFLHGREVLPEVFAADARGFGPKLALYLLMSIKYYRPSVYQIVQAFHEVFR
jgi:hypothetical protein